MRSFRRVAAIASAVFLFAASSGQAGDAARTNQRGSAKSAPVETLKDCDVCPTMIIVPAGDFRMGSDDYEKDEAPAHMVSIPRFALGMTELTFAEWGACVDDGGCGGYRPSDEGWGLDARPVIHVSWVDAQSYVAWLNRKLGTDVYRLPNEAEWEYAARAGGARRFWSGESISAELANFDAVDSEYAGTDGDGDFRRRSTVRAGSLPANPWGFHEILGNVYEWTEDCWRKHYRGAPTDGSARRSGNCSRAPLRGGAWNAGGWYLRSSNRYGASREHRSYSIGFRIARSLPDR